jgi:hypothetical protein
MKPLFYEPPPAVQWMNLPKTLQLPQKICISQPPPHLKHLQAYAAAPIKKNFELFKDFIKFT